MFGSEPSYPSEALKEYKVTQDKVSNLVLKEETSEGLKPYAKRVKDNIIKEKPRQSLLNKRRKARSGGRRLAEKLMSKSSYNVTRHTKRAEKQVIDGGTRWPRRLLPGREAHQENARGCGERPAEEVLWWASAGVCHIITGSSCRRSHRPVFKGPQIVANSGSFTSS